MIGRRLPFERLDRAVVEQCRPLVRRPRLGLAQVDIHLRMRPALWLMGEYDRVMCGFTRAEQLIEQAGERRLLAEIRTLVNQQRLTEENLSLKRTLKQRYSFSEIIGKSEAMQK